MTMYGTDRQTFVTKFNVRNYHGFRYATGEVKGKYGYYDDAGVFREVEYGATPDGGFNPVGNGLEVPNTPVAPRPRTEEVRAAQQVNGRKVSVVRRKRPQGASNRRTNDPRVNLPSRRRQNPTSEVNNRRLPIRPTAAPRTQQQFQAFPAQGPVPASTISIQRGKNFYFLHSMQKK